ncbi:MAG: FTR1 family iron permease [Nitrospirae bacterium]|nr:FTR1 family iron permease [Nitrospirota bacterium]MBI3594221.1 FTR1 family iron permease [Nitrospirota bacterium]
MIGTFIISWRESIEAALLVGILMVYLKKIGQEKSFIFIYMGVIFGIIASLLFGYLSTRLSFLFEGGREEIFSSVILLFAVVILTYMVIWMSDQAKHIKGKIHQKVDAVMEQKKLWALTFLAFTGVFREGIETVLFLWGIFIQNQGTSSLSLSLLSGISGIVLAVLMAWFFFRGFGHLVDMKKFFQITGGVLLFMSAGMLVASVGKLESAGFIPPLLTRIWDSSWLVDDRTLVGHLFSGLFGYRAKPTLMEILVYFIYFSSIIFWIRRQNLRRA